MDGDEALDNVLASRRIPHGRSRNKQGGRKGKGRGKGGNASIFNPLRALGHYEVQLGPSNKRSRQQREDGNTPPAWLEVHELSEEEDGLIGTFNLRDNSGSIYGICVLAGSRKGLQEIVESLEGVENDDDNEDEDELDGGDAGEDDEGGVEVGPDEKTETELSDEKLNRRAAAFEKSSFRNPKFWMRWKGQVHAAGSTDTAVEMTEADGTVDGSTVSESDMGYLVFANNDCDSFEGTVTCPTLGWANLKMHGWKTRAKATPCPVEWTGF